MRSIKNAGKSEMKDVEVKFKEYRDELRESDNEDSKIFAGYLGNKIMVKFC